VKKKNKQNKITSISSSSKPNNKEFITSSLRKTKNTVSNNNILTFEKNIDLCKKITKLNSVKLEKVIQIIHKSIPEIRNVSSILFLNFKLLVNHNKHLQSTEETKLKINILPVMVLTMLYNFILHLLQTNSIKQIETSKSTNICGNCMRCFTATATMNSSKSFVIERSQNNHL
jgi:bromodomain-containing factor 1